MNEDRADVIGAGRRENQEQEPPVPPAVKNQAGDQHQDVLPSASKVEIEKARRGEEHEKRRGCERHASSWGWLSRAPRTRRARLRLVSIRQRRSSTGALTRVGGAARVHPSGGNRTPTTFLR